MNKRFIGVTRFSILTTDSGPFRLDPTNRAKYADQLFDDQRIEDRFEIFSKITLPILKHFAEDHDFVHLLQVSPELPIHWRIKLEECREKYPFLKIVEINRNDVAHSVREEVQSWTPEFEGLFAWFRLDDDDFLAWDYLDALSYLTIKNNVGYAVSFGAVYTGLYIGREFLDIHTAYNPYNSQGQAYICYANNKAGIYKSPPMVPHHEVNKHLPVILNDIQPMAFWTRHIGQDTLVDDSGNQRVGGLIANLQASLSKGRSVHREEVDEKFPTLGAFIENTRRPPAALTLEMPIGQWVSLSGQEFSEFQEKTFIRVDYELRFRSFTHSGATLWLDFEDKIISSGDFPRDDIRGDYRRLFVDEFGHGTITFPAKLNELKRMRIEVDPTFGPIESAYLRFGSLRG